MEPDSSDKYGRFLMFLDAFNIPLVTLSDTTAFRPSTWWAGNWARRTGFTSWA